MGLTTLAETGGAIHDVEHLEDLLSEPTEGVIRTFANLPGDLLILGVGGKMGPTIARMARRASDAAGVARRIVGVARFSDPDAARKLESWGIETIAADLLEPGALDRLPTLPNVLFMAAMKFGATGQEARTWAMNCLLPGLVSRRFSAGRIVAFSTGNVYGLVPTSGPGSKESDPLRPDGEYAMSCLGRERLFEDGSRTFGTPVALIRLNYAVEMRYGVLVDIGRRVWNEEPIDVTMGYLNTIWQGDANAMSLQAFDLATSPPRVVNLTGPEVLSVRWIAERFGERFDRPLTIVGHEAPDALLNDARFALERFGPPRVGPERLIDWIADWLRRGGPTLGKPTKFEVRDGKF